MRKAASNGDSGQVRISALQNALSYTVTDVQDAAMRQSRPLALSLAMPLPQRSCDSTSPPREGLNFDNFAGRDMRVDQPHLPAAPCSCGRNTVSA